MRALFVVAIGLVGGCVQIDPIDGADSDSADPRAVLVGSIDVNGYCDMVGVIEVVMRATRVGCEDPPPAPCTLPAEPEPQDGDRKSCPATETNALLGVEVDAGGRYAVEAVAILTTQEEQAEQCYAVPGEAPPVLVTTADVEARAHIMLDATSDPCR